MTDILIALLGAFFGFVFGAWLMFKFIKFGGKKVKEEIESQASEMYAFISKIEPLYEHEKSMGSMADYETFAEYLVDQAKMVLK